MNNRTRLRSLVILATILIALLEPCFFPMKAEAEQTNYLTRDQMIQAFLNLETQYPGKIGHVIYANATVLGKSLFVFRIGNPNGAGVMLAGGAHGDEKVAPEVFLKYAKWLLNGTETIAQWIMEHCRTLIIPIVNQDTYGVQRKNAHSVDLNRNFDFDWGLRDASSNPTNWKYKGSNAESEPETKTMRKVWNDYMPKQCIDCHNYGNGIWFARNMNSSYAAAVYNKYKLKAAEREQTYYSPFSMCPGSGCFDCTPENKSDLQINGWSVELHSQLFPPYSQVQPAFQRALPLFITLSRQAALSVQQTNGLTDDFESGDFDAWSGTYKTGNDGVTITTAERFKGNYGARFTVGNATTSMRNAQLRKIFDQTTLIYVRGYFYIDYGMSGLLDNNDRFGLIVISSSTSDKASFQIRRVNGQNCFAMSYISGNNGKFVSATSVLPTEKTWYCLELGIFVNGTNGWTKAWVNGNPILSISGINNTKYGSIVQVFWGLYAINGGSTHSMWGMQIYGDQARIADSYIGTDAE